MNTEMRKGECDLPTVSAIRKISEAERERLNTLAKTVIGAAYEVANTLGNGFLEKVYERSLVLELESRGVKAVAQCPMPVFYKGAVVGEYFADVVVEDAIIVELKCVDAIANEHVSQCLN